MTRGLKCFYMRAMRKNIIYVTKKLLSILPLDGYLWYDAETMVTGYPFWYVCALGESIDIQRCVNTHSLYKRDVQVPRQCYVHTEGEGLYSVYFCT